MTPSDTTSLTPSAREKIYRRNFVFFLTDSILFTIALGIVGSTTVIPDFVRHLTSSEILIGLASSLFGIGYLLPQLFIARYLVRYARKKWWFVGPNIPVRFALVVLAGVIIWLGKDKPELVLLAFFLCYGVAAFGDGLVGVPWADLIGTSLDNKWRARMFGYTTASVGILLLLAAPLIAVILGESGPGFPNNYAILFGASGVIFVVSILPGLFIHELPGGKPVETLLPLREFLPDLWRLLRDDLPFRAFVIVGMLTSLFMMAAPFYIGYATVELGLSSQVAVPVLLAMQTIGSVAGAVVYSWFGARNNVLYIRLALAVACLLPISALVAGIVGPLPLYFGFLVAGLATGTNLGSSYVNWLVGYAHADHRPVYVGLNNTLTAIISLIAPFISGTIAQTLGYRPLFVVSLVMALGALFVTLRFLVNPQSMEMKLDVV